MKSRCKSIAPAFLALSTLNSQLSTARAQGAALTYQGRLEDGGNPANGELFFEKLAAIAVDQWNYKWEAGSSTAHIGPMAQDFKAASYPGHDDKSISTLEFDGVELAAIQGLNQKIKEKDAEIQILKQRLEILEEVVLHQKSH